jgi:bifunctional UDP-N-acetylglucosamine pyrophosphorylase / glucosamine-1-phosphate N-acetyltransferase
MFEVQIEGSRRIADVAELRALFGTDQIDLDGAVTLSGYVRLSRGVAFAGECALGDGCEIGQGALLTDVRLDAGNRVRPYTILTRVEAGARNLFGPHAFIRDDCVVGDDCILGAHVEAARSSFGSGVKVSHRAFIGDANVGANSIVGCGVVFCNWDGTGRQATEVGSGVTLGSGTLLVPPLSVGDGAVIGAGSVVTKNVPVGARVIQKKTALS